MRLLFALLAASALLLPLRSSVLFAQAPDAPADVQVDDLRARKDEKKRYFVIRRSTPAPKDGWRLLYVLPGGSGSAEFHPFIKNVAKSALPANYLVVQLVAPVWTPEQAQQNVWPTDKLKPREAKFSTADFFTDVHTEVSKAHPIDKRCVFTLTWSSSGTNGYVLSLLPNSPVTGTFVAMSVFHPQQLPSLTKAKGLPYYLYHSPQDFIPISHPESARDALKKAGAVVELQTYEGGHGWVGNPMEAIRKGVAWLEQQAAGKPADR